MVADLRGHGLSDAPPRSYDLDTLAADVVVVAEGSGALEGGTVLLAGHGFGAIVAAGAAVLLGERCVGLVLVDGGWERVEETSGVDVDEFLRGLDEPPEVLRSMDAWLADRRAFDPASWDADQERAARDAVVETAAGRLLRSVRPHVVEAVVRAMFAYEPGEALARRGDTARAFIDHELRAVGAALARARLERRTGPGGARGSGAADHDFDRARARRGSGALDFCLPELDLDLLARRGR
mgnify:CR=1 FL=1